MTSTPSTRHSYPLFRVFTSPSPGPASDGLETHAPAPARSDVARLADATYTLLAGDPPQLASVIPRS
jgi:hypothetical protein